MNQTDDRSSKSPATTMKLRSRLLHLKTANISLGVWGFYFLAKLILYWKELIGFHTLVNLAFAAFILLPVKRALWRGIKQAATVVLAVALLYYDSWLPAIGRVLSQASLVSDFSAAYLIELAGRFISLPVVAMLVAAGGMYWLASRWVRLDAVIIAVMAAMPAIAYYKSLAPRTTEQAQQFAQFEEEEQAGLPAQLSSPPATAQAAPPAPLVQAATLPPPSAPLAQPTHSAPGSAPSAGGDTAPDMDKALQDFLVQEATRSVSFPAPKAGAIPFDVIFIHVCSLAWDDVRLVGLEHHPLWQRFDILLTRFNTVSAYSGPAAIRMMRANCGQPAHASLYSPAPDRCYLMDSLKRSGFEPGLAMNHDGHFDKFLETVQTQGRLNVPPFPLNGITIDQYAFDDSPVYDDLSVLTHWMESRQKSNSPRVALFYNTASLHDGNHLRGEHSKLNSRETFKIRLGKLLDDLEVFFQSMEKSGRRAIVAMVPEHGAALRGDKMQIAGLREIPTPSITLVPVGIKIIGPDLQRTGRTQKFDKPTSYLAVSHIVSRVLEKPPFANKTFTPADYIADLPVTPYVSQNEGVVMIGYKQRYYLRQDTEWLDYTDF
jgi:cellulose synthase operon protein YhjU